MKPKSASPSSKLSSRSFAPPFPSAAAVVAAAAASSSSSSSSSMSQLLPSCYVCGCPASAECPLLIRQQHLHHGGGVAPYFPFLESHEPPEGARPPSPGGRVQACFLCFSYLTQQWESYERDKVPPIKRIYWLKRVDNGPYTGVEMGVQSEYASQLLGLTPDPQPVQENKRQQPQPSMPPVVHQPPAVAVGRPPPSVPPPPQHPPPPSFIAGPPASEAKRPRLIPPHPHPITVPLPPPGGTASLPLPPTVLTHGTPHLALQQEALDLTVDGPRGTKRERDEDESCEEGLGCGSSGGDDGGGGGGGSSSGSSNGGGEGGCCTGSSTTPVARPTPPRSHVVLDLSMPDKNAVTEVCYVCGGEHPKGLLLDVYARERGSLAYFPSLLLHPRPSRSRPMEASGRVQACKACYNHLLVQWHTYQTQNVAHRDRHYSLPTRQPPPPLPAKDSSAFVCYKCGLEYPSASLQLVYCRPNAEGEPFFPVIERLDPPLGASPISPQGMVQVCLACRTALALQRKLSHGSGVQAVPVQTAMDSRGSSPASSDGSAGHGSPQELTVTTGTRVNLDTSTAIVVANSPTHKDGDETSGAVAGTAEGPACYLCHQQQQQQMQQGRASMHWIPMTSDRAGLDGMYFPFLKFLPGLAKNVVVEDGRVLACAPCYQHLSAQWDEFVKDKVPEEQRQFSLRAISVTSHSPRLTPGLSLASPRMSPRLSTTASAADAPVVGASSSTSSPLPQSAAPSSNGMLLITSGVSDEEEKGGGGKGEPQEGKSYLGLSIRSLEVVPAENDPSAPVLPVITCQRALNLATNCFICGFHSKKGQTYALRSHPGGTEPFFPFLDKHATMHPEARVDDSTVLACLCCFHSLIIQWQRYEKAQVDNYARLYDTYNFTCFICSLKTYRKRLYLLSLKDYPFLKEHNRPANGMVVDNGHSVVVCKDCFSSLRTQYNELEKWGVPVEKRQYNWIQRPPPPEFQQDLPSVSTIPVTPSHRSLGSIPRGSGVSGGAAVGPISPQGVAAHYSTDAASSSIRPKGSSQGSTLVIQTTASTTTTNTAVIKTATSPLVIQPPSLLLLQILAQICSLGFSTYNISRILSSKFLVYSTKTTQACILNFFYYCHVFFN
ncbi:uncharacterized protein LOC143035728 isoform X2 [Oratosquilla oratoria]|uniref:uncharacterized protein LOC143035728 isoform X2 n=1 Tax=Oratosquilla oratoria TaxID=337810 RepID=UPI003F75E62A